MKFFALAILLLGATAISAFECQSFGPQPDVLYSANLQQEPLTMAGVDASQSLLYVYDGTQWIAHAFWATNFPITGTWKLNTNTLMVAMGCGTYSDGVYNFDLTAYNWAVNEWFIYPNFILQCPANGLFYVGEQEGLFFSEDGAQWSRITSLGMGVCNGFAYADHLVTNSGYAIYYSSDAGLTWQESTMVMLQGFRFTDSGVLYAFMDAGSDSDGIWRSEDFGETWSPVLYSSNISAIGPYFGGHLPIGWSQPNERGRYLELLEPNDELTSLAHPSLESPVRQMEVFPLINTPSFYVINGSGLYYLTNFLTLPADDDLVPEAPAVNIYPNPATTRIDLDFTEKTTPRVRLTLYSLRGQCIRSFGEMPVQDGLLNLSLPDLPSGVYYLLIEAGKHSQTKKLLICK